MHLSEQAGRTRVIFVQRVSSFFILHFCSSFSIFVHVGACVHGQEYCTCVLFQLLRDGAARIAFPCKAVVHYDRGGDFAARFNHAILATSRALPAWRFAAGSNQLFSTDNRLTFGLQNFSRSGGITGMAQATFSQCINSSSGRAAAPVL